MQICGCSLNNLEVLKFNFKQTFLHPQSRFVIEMSRTVNFYNISRAMRSQSDYAKKIKYLSASIFGEVRRPQLEKDVKTKSLVTVRATLYLPTSRKI